jgi:AcrR family transcriptional regulator
MGVKERREREKVALREEILDAARDLFIKEGYESLSMRRIAEQIEYSPTTIYLYFRDKDDLIRQVCQETFSMLIQTLQSLHLDQVNPLEGLRKAGYAYIKFGLEHPDHYRAAFVMPQCTDNPRKNLTQEEIDNSAGMQCFNSLRMGVAECIRLGYFRPVDVEATSQAIWANLHGITSLLIGHTMFPWVEREQLSHFSVDTMLNGLLANPATALSSGEASG